MTRMVVGCAIALSSLLAGCVGAIAPETVVDECWTSAPAAAHADDGLPSLAEERGCRPVEEPWVEGTPLRLPCEATKEACDLVDNDNDGITDPHCPTVPCTSSWDCTYDGLLLDADCNVWGDTGGECNQIDGAPSDAETFACWGMLCPPDKKCFSGECIEPGSKLPHEPCVSGAECPMNSGCIPVVHQDDSTAICHTYCGDVRCPSRYVCIERHGQTATGAPMTEKLCEAAHWCAAAKDDCEHVLEICTGDAWCSDSLVCALDCLEDGATAEDCLSNCHLGEVDECTPLKRAMDCQLEACPNLLDELGEENHRNFERGPDDYPEPQHGERGGR